MQYTSRCAVVYFFFSPLCACHLSIHPLFKIHFHLKESCEFSSGMTWSWISRRPALSLVSDPSLLAAFSIFSIAGAGWSIFPLRFFGSTSWDLTGCYLVCVKACVHCYVYYVQPISGFDSHVVPKEASLYVFRVSVLSHGSFSDKSSWLCGSLPICYSWYLDTLAVRFCFTLGFWVHFLVCVCGCFWGWSLGYEGFENTHRECNLIIPVHILTPTNSN